MIRTRIVTQINSLFPVSKIFVRTCHLKMSKQSNYNAENAYFRYLDGAEEYQLSFVYNCNTNGVSRQFNFNRRINETVGTLLERITTNVDKVLTKKKKKKNKKEEQPTEVEHVPVDVKITQNGEDISKETVLSEILLPESETKIQISANTFRVIFNPPWLLNITLPTSILADFPVYPNRFEGLFLEKEKCVFSWYRTLKGNCSNMAIASEWTKVGDGFTYFPASADIGKRLKMTCIPGNASMHGPEMEVVAVNDVEAGPGFCPFITRQNFTKETLSGSIFRVMSYNILADLYTDSDYSRGVLFPYCPPYALHIDYRKQLFLKEILGYNSDIICLQEVDCKIFKGDLLPVLSDSSYDGVFTKKSGQVAEGLACFYNTNRFRRVEDHSIILSDEISSLPVFDEIWSRIKDNEAFVKRVSNRSSAVQATVLEAVENSNEIIVVGNTHLYFHPDADHVRLTQAGLTILWLNNIAKTLKEKMPNKRVSLIICGDFNTVPSCGIYQLFTTGHVPSDVEDWGSNESEALTNMSISQPTILGSACGTPEYTNFTVGFADCLDYIFYQKSNFNVSQVVPFPSVEELKQNTALPSIVFPSDHIALIADLEFA